MIKTKRTAPKPSDEVVFYKTVDGGPAVDVRLEMETVWLTQKQMYSQELAGPMRHLGSNRVVKARAPAAGVQFPPQVARLSCRGPPADAILGNKSGRLRRPVIPRALRGGVRPLIWYILRDVPFHPEEEET